MAGERLAGLAGFEPANARVKVWCLTPWLQPNRETTAMKAIAAVKNYGVDNEIRTHGLQSHNLAL